MLDVVPPSASGRRSASRRRSTRKPATPRAAAQSSVVTLQWQLPARLRRPVREEMARERRRRAARKRVVQFERRPLYTQLPAPSARASRKTTRNVGAEAHTGDVYSYSNPEAVVTRPPYAGSFIAQRAVPTPSPSGQPASPIQKKRRAVRRQVPVRGSVEQKKRQARAVTPQPAMKQPRQDALAPLRQERDIPYDVRQLATHEAVAAGKKRLGLRNQEVALVDESAEVESAADTGGIIQQPRRRFAIPLHFSVFPLQLLPKRRQSSPTRKKKLQSPSRLI